MNESVYQRGDTYYRCNECGAMLHVVEGVEADTACRNDDCSANGQPRKQISRGEFMRAERDRT